MAIINNEYLEFIETKDDLYRIKAKKDFEVFGHKIKKGDIGGLIECLDHIKNDKFWIGSNVIVIKNTRINKSYIDTEAHQMIISNTYIHNTNICIGRKYIISIIQNSDIRNSKIDASFCNIRTSNINWSNITECTIVTDNAKIVDSNVVTTSAKSIKLLNCRIINGFITSSNDTISISPIGSRKDTTTFYFNKDRDIIVNCGCFNDTIEEFEENVRKTHGDNKYAKQYIGAIAYVKSIME